MNNIIEHVPSTYEATGSIKVINILWHVLYDECNSFNNVIICNVINDNHEKMQLIKSMLITLQIAIAPSFSAILYHCRLLDLDLHTLN